MDRQKDYYQRQLSKAVNDAIIRGLLVESRGFLSTRVRDTQHILVALNPYPQKNLKSDNLILIDLKDKVAHRIVFEKAPFLEFVIDAYQMRSEVNALGHFHPPATANVSWDLDFPTAVSNLKEKVGEVLRVKCQTCPSRFAGLCSCFENQRASYAGVNVLLIENDGMVILNQHLRGVIERAEAVVRCIQ